MDIKALSLTGSLLLFVAILLCALAVFLLQLLRRLAEENVLSKYELMRLSGRIFTIFMLTLCAVVVIGTVSLLLL